MIKCPTTFRYKPLLISSQFRLLSAMAYISLLESSIKYAQYNVLTELCWVGGGIGKSQTPRGMERLNSRDLDLFPRAPMNIREILNMHERPPASQRISHRLIDIFRNHCYAMQTLPGSESAYLKIINPDADRFVTNSRSPTPSN